MILLDKDSKWFLIISMLSFNPLFGINSSLVILVILSNGEIGLCRIHSSMASFSYVGLLRGSCLPTYEKVYLSVSCLPTYEKVYLSVSCV